MGLLDWLLLGAVGLAAAQAWRGENEMRFAQVSAF